MGSGPEAARALEWGGMLPQEYRFRVGRISSEAVGILLAVGAVDAAVWLTLKDDRIRPELLWAGSAAALVLLVFFIALRWRSRLRLTPEGAFRLRSADRVETRLAWEEIDELFLLGSAEFEVRGAGKRIRFGGAYEDVDRARDHCSAALSDLRSRLVDRAHREGELVFRTPGSRWSGHALYLATVLLLTAVTGGLILMFVKAVRKGLPIFLVFLGTGWLWRLRRRAGRRGMRVTLRPDGLLLRRLDGTDKVAWSDVRGTEWTDEGDLILLLGKRRRILLPSTLANIAILEGLVEERRGAGERP